MEQTNGLGAQPGETWLIYAYNEYQDRWMWMIANATNQHTFIVRPPNPNDTYVMYYELDSPSIRKARKIEDPMCKNQRITLHIPDYMWYLTNHRDHWALRKTQIQELRELAGWTARATLKPIREPVSVYARALIPTGPLPDSDAISLMVKAIVDGIVDAGILQNDNKDHVVLTGYLAPSKTKGHQYRRIEIILTNLEAPF